MKSKLLPAFVLIGLAASAHADPITPSPTITSGNITFSNFSCSVVSGNGLTCGAITVTAHTSVTPPDPTTGDDGFRIQAAFNASPTTEDVIITYDASITGGLFHDASMYFNGTAVSSVTEDIYNLANNDLIGVVSVSVPGVGLTDDINLSENATNIYVVKDIGLDFNALVPGTISIADQQFSQVSTPEPASLTLLGSALLGLGWLGRRRKVA